ncbi:MAG: lipid 3-O-deacylase PagL [Phycisphaerales bacterium]|nr:lipid 3-O-deacylase PagL [Phycisphaerales bacterium]
MKRAPNQAPALWPAAVVLLATLGAAAASARGQGASPATSPSAAPALPRDDFAAGTRAASLYLGYDRTFVGDPQAGFAAVGLGYYFRDGMSLTAEARTYGFDQDAGSDAALFELDLMFRHHVVRGDGWSLYLDLGAGVTQATRAVPTGGTHFNFIEEAGAGATLRLADGVHLFGGARYWHLSNARIDGVDKNPALNGVGAYVGVMWTF